MIGAAGRPSPALVSRSLSFDLLEVIEVDEQQRNRQTRAPWRAVHAAIEPPRSNERRFNTPVKESVCCAPAPPSDSAATPARAQAVRDTQRDQNRTRPPSTKASP